MEDVMKQIDPTIGMLLKHEDFIKSIEENEDSKLEILFSGDLYTDTKLAFSDDVVKAFYVMSLALTSPLLDEDTRKEVCTVYGSAMSQLMGLSTSIISGAMVYRDGVLYTNDQYLEKYGLLWKVEPAEAYLRVIQEAMDIRIRRIHDRIFRLAKENETLAHAWSLDRNDQSEEFYETIIAQFHEKMTYNELRDVERLPDSALARQLELMAKNLDPVKNLMRMMTK